MDRLGVVAYFFVVFALIVGYLSNLVKIFWVVNDPITASFILRCVGVLLAPLGAILGYM